MPEDTDHDGTGSAETGKRPVSRRDFLKGVGAATALATTLPARTPGSPPTQSPSPSRDVVPSNAVEVSLKVNGQSRKLTLDPRVTLLNALREKLGLTGAKRICDRGSCGGCTVLADDKPIYACMMLAVDAQGRSITTIEGITPKNGLHPIQQAFVEKDALQCGFCTPGFVMSAYATLKSNPDATAEEIREGARGNLCRCGTYPRIFEAMAEAAGKMRGK